jgi:3-dehydroquinate synthase
VSASFDVQSSTGIYNVTVENGSFTQTLAEMHDSFVIADTFFQSPLAPVSTQAIFVDAVETNKSLDASPRFIEQMRQGGANRSTHLVAVGGGIIQDLSAFIASVYMRGLEWTYVPTTVLAMVDSCIGGKSSINVGPYKNLVGTFHSPKQVRIDPAVIATLPDDQRASGLIEAAKITFCRGAEAFAEHMNCQPSVAMDPAGLERLIINSLLSKKWFIETDEFDRKERLLLNFGHTFGHAIEGASHFAIPHGIAVGLGIECAIAFEEQRGVSYAGTPRVAQLQQHLRDMIMADRSVASTLLALSPNEVINRVGSDKKHGTDFYTLILIAPSGDVELRKLPRAPETLLDIQRAVEMMVAKYT